MTRFSHPTSLITCSQKKLVIHLAVPATEQCLVEKTAAADASLAPMATPTSAAAKAKRSFTPSPQYMHLLPKPCTAHRSRLAYELRQTFIMSCCSSSINIILKHLVHTCPLSPNFVSAVANPDSSASIHVFSEQFFYAMHNTRAAETVDQVHL